jgi:hypothetical protein
VPTTVTGDERRQEDIMESREKRWAVAGLGVAALFVVGGLSGAVLDATPLDTRSAPAQAQAAHIHPGSGAESGLTPIFSIVDGHLLEEATNTYPSTTETPIDRLAFQADMRRLWEDHITWTRLYIISAAADLPDRDLTAQRLLRNQTDIGNAIKTFYGEDAGNELTTLLEEHILGAVDLLDAAKAGDQAAVEVARANWYANADAIGAFLSAANPEQWPLAEMQTGMRMHLDVTLEEATARLTGDFETDIAAYDKVHDHILAFADLLSNGIIQQFPDRFARS